MNIANKFFFINNIKRSKQLRPALFLHLQKTAGTSIQNMARYHYGNESVVSHDDYKSLGLEGCKKFPFVSGHFGIKFANELMSNRFSFLFLRSPVDRLLSLYRYHLKTPYGKSPIGDLAKSVDISNFFEVVHGVEHREQIWNNQATQLAFGWGSELVFKNLSIDSTKMSNDSILETAKHSLTLFDYVGFFETFDRDIKKIFTKIGLRPKKIVNIHTNTTDKNLLNLSDLPKDIITRLEKLNEIDIMLYDYAKLRYRNGVKKNWLSAMLNK